MDHIGGHHRVIVRIRLIQPQDIPLPELYIAVFSALLFRLPQHFHGKIRRSQAPAPRGDHAGKQSRAAGTFQHPIRGPDQPRHRIAQRPVGPPVDDIGKDVVHPRHTIPKHKRFLPMFPICG